MYCIKKIRERIFLVSRYQHIASALNEELWSFIEENIPAFAEMKEKERTFDKIYKLDEKERLRRVVEERMKAMDKEEFPFAVLGYLQSIDFKVVIILDNVDPLDMFVNDVILDESLKISEEYGIKIIVSLRTSTLYELKSNPRGTIQAHGPLVLKLRKPDVRLYVRKRMHYVNEQILSEPKKRKELRTPATQMRVTLSVEDATKLLMMMIDTLLQDVSIKVIDYLSYHNLRKINSLLTTYFSTGYLDEQRLLSKFIYSSANASLNSGSTQVLEESPLWILLSSVITNNYATYFPTQGLRCHRGNLINLYDNGRYSADRYFIRTRILNYVRNQSITDRSGEPGYIRTRAMKDDYFRILKGIFRYDEVKDGVEYALKRLLQCDLLESPEFYGPPQKFALEKIERVQITDTGIYFIDEFMNMFEYIMFMKDDVEIENNPYGIQDCIEAKGFVERYRNVYKFLLYLADAERELLDQMSAEQRKLLRTSFSNKSVFVCHQPIEHMISFGKERQKDFPGLSDIVDDFIRLDEDIEEYENLLF